MPLDPTLVRGLTPIAMPERDPNAAVNQLGMIMKMQGLQNEMQANQLNAQKYRQELEDADKLRSALAGVNPNDPNTWTNLYSAGKAGAEVASSLQTAATARDEARSKRFGSTLEQVRAVLPTIKTPDGVIKYIRTLHTHPDLAPVFNAIGTEEEAIADAAAAMRTPEGFSVVVNALSGMTPEKMAEMEDRRRQRMTDAGRLSLEQQKFTFERDNPGFEIKETPQGLVAVNKRTGAAQAVMLGGAAVESTQSPAFKAEVRAAEKTAELSAQAQSDQAARARGAANVLTSLGYNLNDPSADDNVISLIRKSTSGLAEASASQIPRAVGKTTPGRVAIAELETIANNTVMDLLNNKIGAGISNADRDFVIAGLGDIANPKIPAEERIAAWKKVTARLARTANANKFSSASDGAAPVEDDVVRKAESLLSKYPGE